MAMPYFKTVAQAKRTNYRCKTHRVKMVKCEDRVSNSKRTLHYYICPRCFEEHHAGAVKPKKAKECKGCDYVGSRTIALVMTGCDNCGKQTMHLEYDARKPIDEEAARKALRALGLKPNKGRRWFDGE